MSLLLFSLNIGLKIETAIIYTNPEDLNRNKQGYRITKKFETNSKYAMHVL